MASISNSGKRSNMRGIRDMLHWVMVFKAQWMATQVGRWRRVDKLAMIFIMMARWRRNERRANGSYLLQTVIRYDLLIFV